MPRYEQLKLAQTKKRESFTYTKIDDMGGDEKKSTIMKPLIIAVTVIIIASLVFGALKTYSETISIAVKDLFRKEKPEAISLIADPNITTNENNSFLNNSDVFKFLIQTENDTNKIEVIVSDTTNRFETSVRENIINDNPFENISTERIARTSLIPFYNNPNLVREDIIKKMEKTNSIENNTAAINFAETNKNTHTNIFNTIDVSKNLKNLYIVKKENNLLNNIDFEKLNNLVVLENNNTNNYSNINKVVSASTTQNTSSKATEKKLPTTTANIKKSSITEIKTKKEIINATEFSEILKPKDKNPVVVKTMKPAASTYSYTPRTNDVVTKNEESKYTETTKPQTVVKRDEAKKTQSETTKTLAVKKENTVVVNLKKVYSPIVTYNPKTVVKKYYEEKAKEEKVKIDNTTPAIKDNMKNNTDKNISSSEVPEKVTRDISENEKIAINNFESKVTPESLSTEKQIEESLLPKNINENKTQSTVQTIKRENTEVNNFLNSKNSVLNENNTLNTQEKKSQVTSYTTKPIPTPIEENGIKYPSITQTPDSIVGGNINNTKGSSISSIVRPSQSKTKRGVFLVEYNENNGTITLIFKERTFENKNPTLEEVMIALLQGATDKENTLNIISCISKEVKLLDIFRDDNILYLNFNDAFEYNPLGSEGMIVQLYQIVYTATQFDGIDSIVFLVNGEFNETIGSEGYIVNRPFSRLDRNEIIKSAQ